jgi:dihydroxyacetone kinase-like predicted kinase
VNLLVTETQLDHPTVRRWASAAVSALEESRVRLDAANVFPVADSDTGTNLLLTLQGGLAELDTAPGLDPLGTLARGALVSARGNSGIILSEFLRGLSSCLAERAAVLAPRALADAIVCGARNANDAVATPVEGTILTAARSAGQAALAAAEAGDVAAVLDAACAGSRGALARSAEDLGVLASAGVLDAGAYGFTLVLESLREALVGVARPLEMPELRTARPADQAHDSGVAACSGGATVSHGSNGLDGDVEVMFVMHDDRPGDPGGVLRARLSEVGRSVVVVGGDGTWQAHVHTDDPAAAVAVAPGASLRQICVRHLVAQVTGEETLRGVVAGVVSPGLLLEVARTGAVVLHRTGGPWDAAEIARVVEDTGSGHVAVLVRPDAVPAVARAQEVLGADAVTLDAVAVTSDLDVVLALTAAVEGGTAGSGAGDLMRAALERSTTTTTTADDAPQALAAAEPGRSPELVLALWDQDVADAARAHLEAAAHERWPAAEVVHLDSGVPGHGATVGLAW